MDSRTGRLVASGTLSQDRPVRAAALMVAASLCLAVAILIAKVLGTGPAPLHAFQVTFGRYLFGCLALLTALPLLRPSLTRPALHLHAIRISAGFGGATCMFAASAALPLADASALSYLNPIVAMVLAIFILGERIGPIRWSAAAVALIGGLFILRPGTDVFQPAALIGLGAALLIGLEVVMIKVLANREGSIQILLMSNIFGTLLSGAIALTVWKPPSPEQWVLLAAIGLVIVTAQAFYVQSMRAGDASYVVPISYATLVFAAVLDFAVFSVLPVPASVAGAILITLSAVILARQERFRARTARARG